MGSALNQISAGILVIYGLAAMALHLHYRVPEPPLWVGGAALMLILIFARERIFRAFARRRHRRPRSTWRQWHRDD